MDNRWSDDSCRRVREQLEGELERLRAERVPERNEEWPYAVRPDNATTKTKKPPPPARGARRLLQRLGLHPDDPDAVELDLSGRRALITGGRIKAVS